MRSRLTILHMWTTSLVCTGTGPTLYIKSTLWSPSSLENSRAFAAETATWSHMQGSGPAQCPAVEWMSELLLLLPRLLLVPGFRVLLEVDEMSLSESSVSSTTAVFLTAFFLTISSWSLAIIILIFHLDIFQGQCLLQKRNF